MTVRNTIVIDDTTKRIVSGGTQGPAGVSAIGTTITGATAGSVLFAGTSGVLAQDNARLFWDRTNYRLGILTNAPDSVLHVVGTAKITGVLTLGSGTGVLTTSSGVVSHSSSLGISLGGTGQTTANAALNALLPSQVGNSGKFLTTDATNSSWATVDLTAYTPITRTISTTSPITGGGYLSANRTLAWDFAVANTWNATQTFRPAATTGVGLIVDGLASQTEKLQSWRVNGTELAYITSTSLALTPIAGTGTVSPAFTLTEAAHTALTASTERISVNVNLSATNQWATGALTTQRAVVIQAPTYAFVGASTITTAVTLDITGAPIAGTNATITKSVALRINSGTYSSGARRGLEIRNATGITNYFADDGSLFIGDRANSWAYGWDFYCENQALQHYSPGGQYVTFKRDPSTGYLSVGINQSAPTSLLEVVGELSTKIQVLIKGAPSQSANLTNWVNSSDTLKAAVSAVGAIYTYSEYTDASNYSGIALESNVGGTGLNRIWSKYAGTGTAFSLQIMATGLYLNGSVSANHWQINGSGVLGSYTDNTCDIGAAGANRPRSIYVGTSIVLSAANLVTDTTTGTMLATSASQKLGHYGVTPVVQPAHIADPAGGATVDAEARTAIAAINAMLAATGLTAAA